MTTTTQTKNLADDYLTSWDDFVGQDAVKRQLRVAAKSAKMRGVRMGHVMLASPVAGIGKTQLAFLVAREMGTQLHVVSGKMSATQARIALAGLRDRDVLLYDEFHLVVSGGKSQAEEWILHLLENGVIAGPLGPERQPDVTFIAATTDASRLGQNIMSRFEMRPTLEEYQDHEAQQIGAVMAKRIFGGLNVAPPNDLNLLEIAQAANNNPRTIRSILTNLRDLAITEEITVRPGGDYDVAEALSWQGLTADGLNDVAVRYLVTLLTKFGGQAGARPLQDDLGEAMLTEVERVLMAKGYVGKTRGGRVLTQAGIIRARELA